MKKIHENLDFVDLMSERHGELRAMIEKLTNDEIIDNHLSSSQWYVITIIYKRTSSLSQLNDWMNLSRQAIHKAIKNLQVKNIVTVSDVEGNKKEKSVTLTQYGESCCEKYINIKHQIEIYIQKQIGVENMKLMKTYLGRDWHLEDFKVD